MNEQREVFLVKLDELYLLRYPMPKIPVESGNDDWDHILDLFENITSIFPDDLQKEYVAVQGNRKGNRVLMQNNGK